jgi:hypothetical protein
VAQRVKNKEVILFQIEKILKLGPIDDPRFQLVLGNPALYTGSGFILKEPDNPWTQIGQEPTSSFNCHTYSLGDRIGLTPQDWVEGEPTNLSMDTNPMEILLSIYFTILRTLKADEINSLHLDSDLRENDIISFTYKRFDWGIVHQHSGIIRRVNGENWLASKFRLGRLVVTPISEALSYYPQVTKILVYRLKGE